MSHIIYDIIYKLPLAYIICAILLLVLLWSYLRCISQKCFQSNIIWKCGNILIFIGTVALVLRTTLYTRSGSPSELILIPFHSFVEARVQPEMYRSMLMNVFLFFPIGLSLPNALLKKWKTPVLVTIVFAFVMSFGVEFLQYHYHLGRAEIDDVLCNTFGCAIGTLAYAIERKYVVKQSLQQK